MSYFPQTPTAPPLSYPALTSFPQQNPGRVPENYISFEPYRSEPERIVQFPSSCSNYQPCSTSHFNDSPNRNCHYSNSHFYDSHHHHPCDSDHDHCCGSQCIIV